MTDGPQVCALPGCSEIVEQPEDGGPRRLYCSPAHRAAARKMRHAARLDTAPPQPAADITQETTQPIAQAPEQQPSEQPTTELPAPLGVPRQEEPEAPPVPDREWSPAAAWTVTPPALPPAPSGRTIRTITSKRVKKEKPARTAADRKNSGTHVRRRAIASVAIASLVAGGASYFVSENVIPNTPTTLPPQAANQPSMDADVWAGQAEVVLASVSSQLDAVSQAEASWLSLPAQRRAQEPAAVQALKDRKARLEQQRATLMSQLEAFKTLPDRTTELTSAQAQLDAVERTLTESTTTAASPDYQEALRQLESQREIRRQQRDHAAQALTDLRNGVEEALSSPLPADKDDTAPIVERVKAVVQGRPDPGEKDSDQQRSDQQRSDQQGSDQQRDDQEHKAAGGQEPAVTPQRDDGDQERGDTGTTAPPDPERPNVPDILADGGRNSGSDAGDSQRSNGGSESEGPVRSVAGALGSALGQGDTSNRDEGANKRESRNDDSSVDKHSPGDTNRADTSNNHGGLGDVVRGVSGGLLGGSNRASAKDDKKSDKKDDDSDKRGSRSKDDRSDNRSDDRSDNRDDDDKHSSRSDRDDDDDHGGLRGITGGLLGGGHDRDDDGDDDEHADKDRDHKRPSGKAEHKRDKDRSEHRRDKDDDKKSVSDKDRSDKDKSDKDDDGDHASKDRDHKRPSGKAEHKRDKDRSEHRRDKDDDKKDHDKKSDKKDRDKNDRDKNDDKNDDKKSDKGKDHGDKDDDGGKSDKKSSDKKSSDKKSEKKSDKKSDKSDGDSDSGGGDDD